MREFRIPPVKKRLITPLQAQDTFTGVCVPARDGPAKGCRAFRCLPQAPRRRAKGRETRAQTVAGKGGRDGKVFINDLNTPSMQRSAHDSRLYLYLNLLFCDTRGASGFLSFCGHPCRGNRASRNSTRSPAHMRVPVWMTSAPI